MSCVEAKMTPHAGCRHMAANERRADGDGSGSLWGMTNEISQLTLKALFQLLAVI